jgi:hypothetical protein
MSEHISPDGFYRWTGSEWIPTGKTPAAVTGVQPTAVAAKAAFIQQFLVGAAEGPLGMD